MTFTLGFMGTTQNDVLEKAAEYAFGDIFMPFTGSGKDVAFLSEDGRRIESCDTQYLSSCVVQGVFNGAQAELLDPIPRAEGWACTNVPFKRMPEEDLRIIDGLAQTGDFFQRAVLCKMIIRATIGGRLTHWQLVGDDFAKSYERVVLMMNNWVNLPGERIHHLGNCLDVTPKPFDTLWVDPPKVVDTQDVYSRTFWKLNSCLTQETEVLPKWKHYDMIPRHRKLWELPFKRLVQFYCSDVRPTDQQMVDEMEKIPGVKMIDNLRFRHGNRADYIHIYDKE
jgi:hypothetical protein